MIVKWDHFSKDRDENKKCLKPPPRHGIYYEGYNYTTDPITGLIPALPRDPGHSSWPWAPLTAFLRRFRFGSPYDVTYDRLAATGTGKRIHKWLVCFFSNISGLFITQENVSTIHIISTLSLVAALDLRLLMVEESHLAIYVYCSWIYP